MDSDIEGIGTAITGGLAARVVEPAHGEGGGAERVCANCSTELVGTHCHLCGQKAHVHRSIAAIGHDLIHSVLHLDGKFWRTLPLLFFRPGELTRRYAAGERAKFVSPFGMFLFSVFLMFAILQIAGVSLANIEVDDPDAVFSVSAARANLDADLADARAEREALDRRIALAASQPGREAQRTALERQATALDERIANLEAGQESLEAIGGTPGVADAIGDGNVNLRTGWERLDKGVEKLEANPGLALYKLQANFYKFSWLLIPLSVPFVWLLFFYTRRYHLYDHTVFVTYSLAFMSLFFISLAVLGFAGVSAPWLWTAFAFVPLLHMYKQLRHSYRTSRIGALIRTPILATFCFVIASIYFVLLLGIGALG